METLTKCVVNIPKEQVDKILSDKIKILEKANQKLTKKVAELESWKSQNEYEAKCVTEMRQKFQSLCNEYADNRDDL